MLNYREYLGGYEWSESNGCYMGKVINCIDPIYFRGTCPLEVEKAFIDAVDVYFDTCRLKGKAPLIPTPSTNKLGFQQAYS